MKHWRWGRIWILAVMLAALLATAACGEAASVIETAGDIYAAIGQADAAADQDGGQAPDEHGVYSGKDEVALYLHTYGRLPDNYISKAQAREQGWEGGSLEPYYPGCCIGGDRFGNREGLLPQAEGRSYYECDIGTLGQESRGAQRIVFSNDGLIYYTADHYQTFELLYGEE